MRAVAKCAADNPDEEWIHGGGWAIAAFPPEGIPSKKLLDAFEYARKKNGVRDNRHHIAHLQLVHPDEPSAIGDTRVLLTLFGGRAVHGSLEAAERPHGAASGR